MSEMAPQTKMRSWLFAPGDSLKKMTKAGESQADIALLDLEDAVMPDSKPQARKMVRDFLAEREDSHRIWVRINPLSSGEAERDLDAIMDAAPGGIMLPKAEGGHDVEALDALLNERESGFGLARGSTKVAALVTETAAAMFTTGTYAGALAWPLCHGAQKICRPQSERRNNAAPMANTATHLNWRAACVCWAR